MSNARNSTQQGAEPLAWRMTQKLPTMLCEILAEGRDSHGACLWCPWMSWTARARNHTKCSRSTTSRIPCEVLSTSYKYPQVLYLMHNMFHAQLSCVTIRRLVPNPNPCGDPRFVHLDVAKSCAAGGSWTSWCCMRCFNVFNVYLTIKYRDSTGSIMMYNKDTVGI